MSLRHVIALGVLLLAPAHMSAQPSASYQRTEVRFQNAELALSGTLFVPEGPGPFPGVVIIHGSGTSDRSNPWTTAYAEALASRNVAVLYPDKRGSGESAGNWKRASFQELASDAVAGVRYLEQANRINPERVGVIGFSQGGHVAPVAATQLSALDFVISVSGSTVPIVEQIADEVEMEAERKGLSPQQIETINDVHHLALTYGATGEGWDRYISRRREVLKHASPEVRNVIEPVPDNKDHWVWSWARAVGRFDPMTYWKKVEQPSLFVYGGNDENVRVMKSISRLHAELSSEGPDYAVMYFSDNGHALYREDLLDGMVSWIKGESGK